MPSVFSFLFAVCGELCLVPGGSAFFSKSREPVSAASPSVGTYVSIVPPSLKSCQIQKNYILPLSAGQEKAALCNFLGGIPLLINTPLSATIKYILTSQCYPQAVKKPVDRFVNH
jgi:hypothetical protein